MNSNTMSHKKSQMFDGNLVKLPWKEWQDIEICPKGIKVGKKGFFTISELELAIWKARCYDRHKYDNSGIMRGFLPTEI